MKNHKRKNTLMIATVIVIVPIFLSWGEAGHYRINRAAVLSLPEPLQSFFYNHIDFITQAAPLPDVRRFLLDDRSENSRHYFDLENYGGMDSLPSTLQDASDTYPKEFLSKNGILPWYIENRMDQLTRAFKEKRKSEILFLVADLGHYIADANTPLHTTVNYDGQLTDQTGIHSFWETKMVKLFSSEYDYYSGEAVYICDIRKEIKRMILNSNALSDTLLRIERTLRLDFANTHNREKTDPDSTDIDHKPVFSDDYARQYHEKLNGMVERQMQASILATASFWYTAWVNAGKPDLSDLDPADQTERNKVYLKRELKLYRKGELKDILF